MRKLRRLVIVSAVVHYKFAGQLFAYGPYAREIDIWADLFPEVVIAAPLRMQHPPADSIPFTRSNISVAPQIETGGNSLPAKVGQFIALPGHIWLLGLALSHADAIQVRCPGNLGLLGCLLAPLFRKPRVAKYANQWKDYQGEPWTSRWQKQILRSRWWKALVLVYGNWPNQPLHIVPFFTSVVDEKQMARARAAVPRNWAASAWQMLFVGRLSPDKNVDVILRAMALMGRENKGLRLQVVGDGPARGELQSLSLALGLAEKVKFQGAVPYERVLDFYDRAHLLVLPSQSEGWPKAIAEAMTFGLVCIGSNRGFVPQMLAEGRGLVVEPRDPTALADIFRLIMADPTKAAAISVAAAQWSRRFTLEGLRQTLAETLENWWDPSSAKA